jgi:peptidoglycan-associated lipoprotein
MARKLMTSGVVLVLVLAVTFLVGACSQRKSRVDSSDVKAPSAMDKLSAEEEEARRRAEAERRAQAERQAQSEGATQRSQKVMDEVQAFESEPVYFDFDRSEIRPEYRPLLENKAAWLKARPEHRIRIEGHCDERGTAEYNLALGEKRASSVMDYLVTLGVPAKRMSTISYGEERPVFRGQDESAWARNRRAEFRLLK